MGQLATGLNPRADDAGQREPLRRAVLGATAPATAVRSSVSRPSVDQDRRAGVPRVALKTSTRPELEGRPAAEVVVEAGRDLDHEVRLVDDMART